MMSHKMAASVTTDGHILKARPPSHARRVLKLSRSVTHSKGSLSRACFASTTFLRLSLRSSQSTLYTYYGAAAERIFAWEYIATRVCKILTDPDRAHPTRLPMPRSTCRHIKFEFFRPISP